MNIPNVPKPTVPLFTDKVITQMQDILKAKISWLDYVFGRSQKLVTIKDKQNYFYPGVHISEGTYISVLPDQFLGNFSFFNIDDPQTIDFHSHLANNVSMKYSLIFWFNLNVVFPGISDRNTEALKAQILTILTRETFLTQGRITVKQIYEQAENIYKGYSLKEVDGQYLMQPYAGLRFEGDLIFMEGTC